MNFWFRKKNVNFEIISNRNNKLILRLKNLMNLY